MSNELALRATISDIINLRQQAISEFESASRAMQAARAALDAAVQTARRASNGKADCLGWHQDNDILKDFHACNDSFIPDVSKNVDRGIWNHLIEAHGLEQLMDHKAREDFRKQLAENPPEVTVETALATISGLIGQADEIFKRGIANVFSKLDRRFRTHDGFKIGSKIIISYAIDQFGTWNRGRDEIIRDVERTLHVLDGKPHPERHLGIIGKINEGTRGHGLTRKAFIVEDGYFRVKGYANGNAHLYFKRDDLVLKVNQLLAEWYGGALGAAPDVADVKPEERQGRSMAKNFGAFFTPDEPAETVLEEAMVFNGARVLEPSAGAGALSRRAARKGAEVVCVEIQQHLAEALRSEGIYKKVVNADFLDLGMEDLGTFDIVVMNPPFDRGLDMDHILHALKFLRPGGRLVSIASASIDFREEPRYVAFRKLVADKRGRIRDLPPLSFASSGTNVNTCIVHMVG